jgi:nicotinamide riboside transporter PnuC
MQLIMTTMALIFQIVGGIHVVFQFQDVTTEQRLNWLTFALETIAVLCIWELIHRQAIGWPLLIHHVTTLAFLQFATSSLYETNAVIYMRAITLMGMYATTEQLG